MPLMLTTVEWCSSRSDVQQAYRPVRGARKRKKKPSRGLRTDAYYFRPTQVWYEPANYTDSSNRALFVNLCRLDLPSAHEEPRAARTTPERTPLAKPPGSGIDHSNERLLQRSRFGRIEGGDWLIDRLHTPLWV
jgi:hypothetical protein